MHRRALLTGVTGTVALIAGCASDDGDSDDGGGGSTATPTATEDEMPTAFPAEMAALYEAYRNGEFETVRRLIQEVVMPVISATSDLAMAAAMNHLAAVDGLNTHQTDL